MAIGPNSKRKAVLKTVLEGQKISFTSKVSISKSNLKKLLKYSIFISFAVLTYVSFNKIKNTTPSIVPQTDTQLKVVLLGDVQESIQEKISSNIQKLFAQNLLSHSLLKTAESIQEKSGMAQVHLYMDNKRQITAFIKPRTPLLYMSGEGIKFLSTDGEIYEDLNFNPKFNTILSGVFDNNSQMNIIDSKNCVKTSEKEKKILLDAIQLITQASTHSLEFSTIEYKKYRGFSSKLANSDTTVLFGLPPYDKQFQRLLKIIDDATKKNISLKTIEIDFNDKAFITEHKK